MLLSALLGDTQQLYEFPSPVLSQTKKLTNLFTLNAKPTHANWYSDCGCGTWLSAKVVVKSQQALGSGVN